MQQTFRITDEDGIHARPATALVNTANKFKGAESFAEANGKKSNIEIHSGCSFPGSGAR